jgi:prolyl oligopeptidase
MNQLFDQKSYGCITKHGDYYYYAYSEGNQKQRFRANKQICILHKYNFPSSAIYRQRKLLEPKELFLDPNQFSADGTAAISQMAFSRDGSMMAYAISDKGSDVTTIRVCSNNNGFIYIF